MSEEQTPEISRRSFLQRAGMATAGVAAAPLLTSLPAKAETVDKVFIPEGAQALKLNVNGKDFDLKLEPRATLLDTLRETLHLTGTKKGCDHGQCGACTVHVNGQRVNSCLSFAIMHVGDKITTIEGLGTPEKMHPMQKSFCDNDAFQCGYCTSGQIMSAVALLKEPHGKKDVDIKEAMSGNICRCGAYKNILTAIQQVKA
jgi:xanthine dehydrogenase YagT iron-sulfur-binding subunit